MCGGGGILSALTGGLSDVFQGNAPFSAPINEMAGLGLYDKSHADWLNNLSKEMFSGGFANLPEAYNKATKNGGFDLGTFIDRSIDPAGTIDYSLRKTGDNIYQVAPGVSPWLNTAGTTIGGIVGSYIPVIGTAAGAAIGSGIGSKLGQGTRNYDYGGDLTRAGIAAGTTYAAQGLGELAGGIGGEIGASSPTYNTGSFSDYTNLAEGANPAYKPTFYEPYTSSVGQGAGFYTPMSTTPDLTTGLLADATRTWNDIPQYAKDIGGDLLKSVGKEGYNMLVNSLMKPMPGQPNYKETPAPLANYIGTQTLKQNPMAQTPDNSGLISNVKFTQPELTDPMGISKYTEKYKNLTNQEKKELEETEKNKNPYKFDIGNTQALYDFFA